MTGKRKRKVIKPSIAKSVFVAEGARILGDVEIGEGSSIWFNAVLRETRERLLWAQAQTCRIIACCTQTWALM